MSSGIRDNVGQQVNDILLTFRRKIDEEHYDYHYEAQLEALDAILSIPNLKVVDLEAELPEIPTFVYSEATDRPLLRRGAINYSKMFTGWVKEVL